MKSMSQDPDDTDILSEMFHGAKRPWDWLELLSIAPIVVWARLGLVPVLVLTKLRLHRLAEIVGVIWVLFCFVPFVIWIAVFKGLPN